MWANTGLCSCSGPWLPIHQPFILCKWNKVTSGNQLPAGSKCSPAALHSPPSHPSTLYWSFLLGNPTTGACACYNWVFHFQCSTWCQRHMAAEHRNERTRNAHMSPWPVSVATLSCISLATTRTCRWTLMVIHQKKVFALQYLSRQWCRWWLRWETLVWFMRRSSIPLFELPLCKIMNIV